MSQGPSHLCSLEDPLQIVTCTNLESVAQLYSGLWSGMEGDILAVHQLFDLHNREDLGV